MIYWFTGQPGHGKTLHALSMLIDMKKDADAKHAKQPDRYPQRPVFVCNVREMQFDKVGAEELSPAEFKSWADSPEYLEKDAALMARREIMSKDEYQKARETLESEDCATLDINPKFKNAIILIDEAYEHGIFPKRAPGAAVPRHVERMAKHRHHGIDFICVCQSPDKQCDGFLHDLFDRHIHVRRRFGTKFVHLREFDRFERNPEKATPLILRRTTLPKHVFGMYKSTEMDTTERRIPWYYIALVILVPGALGFSYWTFAGMGERLGGEAITAPSAKLAGAQANGASATVAEAARDVPLSPVEYAARFTARVPSQPWSAPAYDNLPIPTDPPRVFCMSSKSSAEDVDAYDSCTCLTEQGTRYELEYETCVQVARQGQYEPLFDERSQRALDAREQMDEALNVLEKQAELRGSVVAGSASVAGNEANIVPAPEPHF